MSATTMPPLSKILLVFVSMFGLSLAIMCMLSIGNIIVGFNYLDASCSPSYPLSLGIWEIVYGIVTISYTLLIIGGSILIFFKPSSYIYIFNLSVSIIHLLFNITWNIVGAFVLVYSSVCLVDAFGLWRLALTTLIVQWIIYIAFIIFVLVSSTFRSCIRSALFVN